MARQGRFCLISPFSFQRLMVPFRADGHILLPSPLTSLNNIQNWQTLFGIHLRSTAHIFHITDIEDIETQAEGSCQVEHM